ncbi:MAG TPA: hypothetical protein VIJ10_07910 [Vicinamibacteria bacterium]
MRAPLVVGIVVVASFLGLMLWTTEGHFVAQVSDLYVVAQYARALAEGHPFRYNAGEAPTSGATSLLHTAVLALADASGARGEGLIAFAVLLGAALYLASIPLAARVAERLSGPREGRLAGMLVALSGPVVWGFLYGSDIAPFLFLALLLLERWLAYCAGGPARGLALAGSLLALCRPEGLPVGLALAAAGRWRRPASPADRLWLWLPLATGLAVLTLQRIVTGSWLQTSVAEKALLPSYGPVETLAAATQYGVDVLRGLLLGLYPPETAIGFARGEAAFFFPPLALVLVLLAVARSEAPLAVPARLWLALVLLIFALTGPNVFMGVHFNRYLMWAFPGLLAFVAAGLGALARLAARDDARLENDLFRAGAALALLLGALSTAHFAGVYAQLAGSTWRREIPMAAFIRERLPKGVAIANAATSVEYLTGHRNLNLHGVTSPGFAGGRSAEREAGMFESLGRIGAPERPPFLLLTRAGREGSELMQALAPEPPVFATTSFEDDLVLYQASWELVDGGEEPVLGAARAAVDGLERVDRIDVCDPRDEAEHAYSLDSRRGELVLFGSVAIGPAAIGPAAAGAATRLLADAGRLVLGGESFTVRTRAGRELVVIVRSRSSIVARSLRASGGLLAEVDVPSPGIVFHAGGREVARLGAVNAPGWNEHVVRLPAQAMGDGSTRLELRGRYAAFHYWFYQ